MTEPELLPQFTRVEEPGPVITIEEEARLTSAPEEQESPVTVDLVERPGAYMVLFESVKAYISAPSIEGLKPWGTMTVGLEKPSSLSDAMKRVMHNQTHFRSNYVFMAALFTAYTIFTTPSLFLMALMVGGFAAYALYWTENYELKLFGRTYDAKTCITVLSALCLVYTIFSGSIMGFLWSLFVAFSLSGIHSVMCKVPEEDLFAPQEIQK